MTQTEVQLDDGEAIQGRVRVMANGWVRIVGEDSESITYPPHRIECIVGDDINFQSPHGRI